MDGWKTRVAMSTATCRGIYKSDSRALAQKYNLLKKGYHNNNSFIIFLDRKTKRYVNYDCQHTLIASASVTAAAPPTMSKSP